MALYAHIVDGVLESVGELPSSARRLDTGELLGPGEVIRRLEATGYYPLDVDVSTIKGADGQPIDATKQATLTAQLAAATTRKTRRQQFQAAVEARADLARTVNWDWIDQFCHPTVASINYVSGQSPNAGAGWGAPTAAVAADRLRLGESYAMVENIQLATAVEMLTEAVSALLEAVDIDPPPDR